MMLQVIVYAVGISTALSVAAFCGEKLSAVVGRPRRFAWAAAMVLSVLWPLAAMLLASPVDDRSLLPGQSTPAPAVVAAGPVAPSTGAVDPVPSLQRGALPPLAHASWKLPAPSDQTLLLIWAVSSCGLLCAIAATDLFVRNRSFRWRRQQVLGSPLLVSDVIGPALLGTWRPRIVVPRWFLDEPATTQSLILQHEHQHIAARDPLLLRLALLIVVAAPWNLPLWWLLRRLRQAIELDCDARVLRAGARANSYGEVLLTVTQRAGRVPAGAIAMGEPASALERRIRHLTSGSARHPVRQVVAAVTISVAGIGAALALDAPTLPLVSASSPMLQAAPVLPAQSARGLPRSAIRLPDAAQASVAPATSIAAAQPSAPLRAVAAQAARDQAAQALTRLRPPVPARDTENPDDPRSVANTTAAILAARPGITSEFSEETLVTVFMTADGRIERSYVGDVASLLWGDLAYPVDFSVAHMGAVPELLAKRWEPLGLRPEQLGQMGLVMFDIASKPGAGNIRVLYAWPRRSGEPIGGRMPVVGQTWRSSFTYADAVAVVERHLPGALRGNSSAMEGRPWMLLSPEGEVVETGYAPTTSHPWARAAIVAANPDRRVGLVVGVTDRVILGWLEPDQP